MLASEEDHEACVRVLLENNADMDAVAIGGLTAQILASSYPDCQTRLCCRCVRQAERQEKSAASFQSQVVDAPPCVVKFLLFFCKSLQTIRRHADSDPCVPFIRDLRVLCNFFIRLLLFGGLFAPP